MGVQNKSEEREEVRALLPRDISRFKKLYPNGRAVIKDNPDATIAYLSTAELVLETASTSK